MAGAPLVVEIAAWLLYLLEQGLKLRKTILVDSSHVVSFIRSIPAAQTQR